DQVRLSRGCHPFSELAFAYGKLLAHFDEVLALPNLYGLKVSAQRHCRRRIHKRDNHALCVCVTVVEELEVKGDLYHVSLLLHSADIEVSGKLSSAFSGSGHRGQR